MSLSLPPFQGSSSSVLRVHMDATLQPARRIIVRLLEADAGFFREFHYVDPLRVDPSDQGCNLVFIVFF
jgi:hypothetical protein